ncbi:uncharacterized protein F5891DRAFT_1038139 [Suillus fuscotomentosus]|uniref:Secreted protein n=1 Tax=Suillus fuscotomentosus TaxID=1912939 RepID=A0AAD4DZC5_9AGAM|nr:uncharacterized protein F5891DRAFT_1057453 [Suillus fuscotomentosus]XP_041225288.1 uncharacterized protein F5891DRAFT_1038139 [Suillus fuscotomentosus]KAG1895639.1 hypothetical protein F5891DRAFT_1057453 [Suillus fuscotomentosus]KAG1899712.1 hypothetical protein F5891DRAFT_1038139 [Suillus fuscotomentosus]
MMILEFLVLLGRTQLMLSPPSHLCSSVHHYCYYGLMLAMDRGRSFNSAFSVLSVEFINGGHGALPYNIGVV